MSYTTGGGRMRTQGWWVGKGRGWKVTGKKENGVHTNDGSAYPVL